MKKFVLIFILFIQLCGFSEEVKSQCVRNFEYGRIKYCLPSINGFTECYNNLLVMKKADETETNNSMALAVYIEDDIFSMINKLKVNEEDFYIEGDIIKISAPINSENLEINETELSSLASMVSNNYINRDWNELKNEIDKYSNNISFDVPVIIDKYSLSTNTYTFIMMSKVNNNQGYEFYKASAMNLLVIKKRFMFVNYIIDYIDNTSIKELKPKNDFFIRKFLSVN
jgi:hypothetical protein